MFTATAKCVAAGVLAAAVFAATAEPGRAADAKVYPGLECVPTSGTVTTYSYASGAIVNTSGAAMLAVQCPIINDQGTSIRQASVLVRDQNSTQTGCCELFSRRGEVTIAQTRRVCSTGGVRAESLVLGSVAGAADAHYYLSCTIPQKASRTTDSRIFSYSVSEE